MRQAPSRRKANITQVGVASGDFQIDLSSMQFTVGDSPHTLAECVKVAVLMWSSKYHRRGGEDRSAEIVSIVWQLMLKRESTYSPTNIAHWACKMLFHNQHLVPLGKDVQGKNSGHEQVPMVECRSRYGNPAKLVQSKLDWEAFYASIDDPDAKVMLDMMIAGYSMSGVARTFGWGLTRRRHASAWLRARYAAFTFSAGPLAKLVRDIRSIIKAAAQAV